MTGGYPTAKKDRTTHRKKRGVQLPKKDTHMAQPPRICLTCGTPTTHGARCQKCQTQLNTRRTAQRNRPHYAGDYRKRAKAVRDAATTCWICGEGARINDPWTADHIDAGNPLSPLAPAHRSCNSRRGNKQQ